MNTQDTQPHGNSKINPKNDILAMLENDDMDLDFEFTPITTGLGFKKDNVEKDMIKQRAMNRLKVMQMKKSKEVEIAKARISRGDLTPFYEEVKETPKPSMEISLEKSLSKPLEEKIIEPKVELKEAPLAFRFVGHLVDLVIVSSITVVTLVLLIFIANLSLPQLVKLQTVFEIKAYIATLFVSYYLFYFTFMDTIRSSSIGKSIVNICVRKEDGSRASIPYTFFRALISTVGYITCGLPFLIRANDALSKTIVVFNEDTEV